ncbi:hypothetical protein OSTOST_08347 [Ostertagia ostertagi]
MLVRTVVILSTRFWRECSSAVDGNVLKVLFQDVSSHLIMGFLVAVDAEDELKKACGFTCKLITWLLYGLTDKFNENKLWFQHLNKAHISVHVYMQPLS